MQPSELTAKESLERGVSRGTMSLFEQYVELLIQWQSRLNLVSPLSLKSVWERHILDSAQLVPLSGQGARRWIDLGSGAGFPGMIAAMMDNDVHVRLVESRAKKCAFLQAVVDELGLNGRVRIDNRRVEDMPSEPFDIVSARALAALPILFDWGLRFASSTTQWIIPKGRQAEKEIAQAKISHRFEHRLIPSRTDRDARIVLARDVRRRLGN